MITRRGFAISFALTLAGPALAQHAAHDPLYSGLKDPKLTDVPHETAAMQRVYDSPAPKAPNQGRWVARAALPLPRGANHVGVVVMDSKLCAIGGHTEQNRKPDNLCFVYDGKEWRMIASLPRANAAIGCAAIGDYIHVAGGGGPVMGGDIRSAVHEAFTLA